LSSHDNGCQGNKVGTNVGTASRTETTGYADQKMRSLFLKPNISVEIQGYRWDFNDVCIQRAAGPIGAFEEDSGGAMSVHTFVHTSGVKTSQKKST